MFRNIRSIPLPEGKTREAYLRELCYKGLHERYGERTDSALITRLDYELDVLEKTGFVSYFLIVWDFIHYAKERGIPVGPGRGSAAGSMVAYVLGITDIDPLQFNLLFERFLNPDRVSPPDIDVDFCEARRGEVLEYVRQKYGERRVSQIITFGKLKAKSVVRDVGRVIGLSYGDADRIAKMIPNELNITLAVRRREDARFEKSDRERASDATTLGLRDRARRSLAQRRRARRRRGHRRPRSLRLRAALPRQQRHGRDQPVRHGTADRSRDAEDGFPRAENAHRD